ncbi:ricin-type beta-trefoil lectin domain protein [Streptomyces sp. NPDC001288]|uniref:RICIN domain-containing protein n=1 Tax=unclassified Streptomyces TaxID=2593676 RepID=UPI00332F4B98
MLLPLLLLLWPVWWHLAQSASADGTASYSVLYDPGPAHKCYGLVIEGVPDTTPDRSRENFSGCGDFAADKEFTRGDPGHSAWDIGTYGWNRGSWGRTPGYSFTPQTGTRTVSMTNNAAGTGCTLHETNVSYSYVGSQLRPNADRSAPTLADGTLDVTYHAKIHQKGGFTAGCQRRALLTTDFIFEDPDHGAADPDVLSVVHFDPGHFMKKTSGVLYQHEACRTGAGGCRLQVSADSEMLGDSRSGAVSDDISALFDKYAYAFNPNHLPKSQFTLRAVQVVSTNVGTSTTTTVSDIDARLTPQTARQSTLRNSSTSSSMCLDDRANGGKSGDIVQIHTCNGTSAQKWTMGSDGTVKVHGLCLDGSRSGAPAGGPVVLFTCSGAASQKWVAGRNGQVYGQVSGKCLQVAKSVNNAPVTSGTCWGGTIQKWWTAAGRG